MKIEGFTLPIGTKLYRFINAAPQNIKLGMTQNAGKEGRCNKYCNIYYCCKSLAGIALENAFKSIKGSLIMSEVIEPVIIGIPTDEKILARLRGRTSTEPPEVVHTSFHAKLGNDFEVDYNETSRITMNIIKHFPDGVLYPSMHSIDTVINGRSFDLCEELGFSNIALTDAGYSKIKEHAPTVYWNDGKIKLRRRCKL